MQVVGFKSFAEKTDIDFQNGLTAIVGPNGSGKSNVIEAIRWVLGEQSAKQLRSTKMSDVIFSGAKHHRALNRASVTLTFDNADHDLNIDYTEVVITRKLFRNGDSSYYLNHNECRLKDINNLFMDTGVGLGSFSIISQGNVEAIFNSKPEERRNIIETTAGIYKYRQRKQVANQRLTETDDNLARVNDIILELQTQVEDLKQQRDAAEQYQRLNQSLKDWHQKQLATNANQMINDYHTNENHSAELKTRTDQLGTKIERLRDQKRSNQSKLDQIATANEQIQAKILTTTNQIEQLKSQQQLATQQSSFATERIDNAKQRLAVLVDQYAKFEDTLTKTQQQQVDYQESIAGLNVEIQETGVTNLDQSITDTETKLAELRNQYLNLLQATSNLKNQLNYADKNHTQFNAQQQAIQQRVQDAKQVVAKLQTKLINAKRNDAHYQKRLKQVSVDVEDAKQQLQAKQALVDREQKQWYDQLRKVQQLKAKLNGLNEFQDSHAGYLQGSKQLLAHREELSGIIGPVADFIDVDNEYAQAIETALGMRVQQIMVDDNASGRDAIQFMTKHRLGRVTLLPINSLTRHSIPERLKQQLMAVNGYVGIASDLVQFENRLSAVNEYLLGNVIVASNLKVATKLSQLVQRRYRIVSLDGQVVNAGGSITGGAAKRQGTGMLVQKNQLQQLRDQVVSAEQKLTELEGRVKQAQATVTDMNDEMQKCYDEQTTIEQKKQLAANQLAQVEREQQVEQRELATQRINLRTLVDNQAEEIDATATQSQLADLNTQLSDNQSRVGQLQTQLTKFKEQRNTVAVSAQIKRERLVVMQSELKHLDQTIDELNQKLANNQQEQIQLNQQIQRLTDQTNGQLTNQDLDTKIGLLNRSLSDLRDHFTTNKHESGQLKQVVEPLDKQIDSTQDTLLQCQQSLDRLAHQMNTTEERLHSIKVVAQQKYGLSFKTLVSIEVNESNHIVDSQIRQLQKQIDGLGPVNINSIDQFIEVNDRYQFLKQQADDLIQSKEQLTATMDKMDSEVKARFEQTFTQLQAAFKTTFQEIFGGGDAKLKLTDPNHLLTTGIDIMAQPPGKRFRNMMLLSGGERSLTAIALLFAILKLHPVPFCILDEAESALDPANVDRFARYIQKLKNETQFIVITHRKETMVYADNLYGVTMQDSGISKILAVNLKKAQITKG
ncbi:chromosome segregation protein SMC [Lactobacillaceae bacterium Scapto_B20]